MPEASPQPQAEARATWVGAGAIALWSTLALLSTAVPELPPIQLCAMAFSLAGGLSLLRALALGRGRAFWRQPPAAWALGVGGLLGYHLLYFWALRLAPPVEANLINYLWPLLIVLFAALLPGERLRWFHLAGAGLGLAGSALLVLKGGAAGLSLAWGPGHLAALGAAFVWAGYSVANRSQGEVPTEAVGAFCLASAALAWLAHAATESSRWPAAWFGWLVVLAIGLGPLGLAFFAWDHGVKRGHLPTLGALSYATPLLSTGWLLAFGQAQPSWRVAAAGALIVLGAALGSLPSWWRPLAAAGPSQA